MSYDDCPICAEECGRKAASTILPCGHILHTHCLIKLLRHTLAQFAESHDLINLCFASIISFRCPICRSPFHAAKKFKGTMYEPTLSGLQWSIGGTDIMLHTCLEVGGLAMVVADKKTDMGTFAQLSRKKELSFCETSNLISIKHYG